MSTNKRYDIETYPLSRIATFDVGEIGRKKHHVTTLLEVNISKARQRLRRLRQEGADIGLVSWLVSVLGETMAEHPNVHAINYGKNKQVVFKDVSISMPIEKTVDGKKVPLALLIENVNRISAQDIQKKINKAVNETVKGSEDFVLGNDKGKKRNALFFALPRFIRLFIWKRLLANPFRRQKMMGTAVVTNIGITGSFPGWIIPKSLHNLTLGVGTITKKAVVIDGKIEVGDILHLTILFDHDVIDGVPAAKFTQKLVSKLEKAHGLISLSAY